VLKGTMDVMKPMEAASYRPARIRRACADELGMLQEIERAAGRCFRDLGMPEIAADQPLSVDALDQYRRAGMAWVAVDQADDPVAYLIAVLVDSNVHVEQVSVHPDHARRGIGKSLLEWTARQAGADGVSALTLTTFEQVPWNAPYYVRCGFRLLHESEWTPGLRAIRERESAHGLDRWPRVCMRRDLT
jgi:GNAT superfamily N-acetyltransferase